MLKSTAQAARASQWIENKLKRSITKNMMYPACSDMRLPGLIPYDSPDVARPLPKAKPEAGAAPAPLLVIGMTSCWTASHRDLHRDHLWRNCTLFEARSSKRQARRDQKVSAARS